MKIIKNIFSKTELLLFILFFFASSSLSAQNELNIRAKSVSEGVEISITENGVTTSTIYSYELAKGYLEELVEDIEVIEGQNGEKIYKIDYSIKGGKQEVVKIDVEDFLKDFNIDFDDVKESIDLYIKNIFSNINYKAIIDANGNKTIEIKKIK